MKRLEKMESKVTDAWNREWAWFWSRAIEPFPPEAVDLLREVVEDDTLEQFPSPDGWAKWKNQVGDALERQQGGDLSVWPGDLPTPPPDPPFAEQLIRDFEDPEKSESRTPPMASWYSAIMIARAVRWAKTRGRNETLPTPHL